MIALTLMSLGLSVHALAAVIAFLMTSTHMLPSWTASPCKSWALLRLATCSVEEGSVWPPMARLLSSPNAINFSDGRSARQRRQRGAVRIVAVGLVGRDVAHDRLDPDERGLARARLGRRDCLPDHVHVLVAVLHREPLPVVAS